MSKRNTCKRNVAPPKATKEPDFTEQQQKLIAVAVRESNLELLDNLVTLLTHLRTEVV